MPHPRRGPEKSSVKGHYFLIKSLRDPRGCGTTHLPTLNNLTNLTLDQSGSLLILVRTEVTTARPDVSGLCSTTISVKGRESRVGEMSGENGRGGREYEKNSCLFLSEAPRGVSTGPLSERTVEALRKGSGDEDEVTEWRNHVENDLLL